MTWGFDGTVSTVTILAEKLPLRRASASSMEIFWMMEDLFSPVPASGAPAFCTKNISFVGGYLMHTMSGPFCTQHGWDTHHVTASWKRMSPSADSAIWVSDGLLPITS